MAGNADNINLKNAVNALKSAIEALNNELGETKDVLKKQSDLTKEQQELLKKYTDKSSNEPRTALGKYRQDKKELSNILNSKNASEEEKNAAKSALDTAKGAAVKEVIGIASEVIGTVADSAVKIQKSYYEIQVRNLKVEREIVAKKISLYGDALKKANDVAVTKITGDITEGAYSAYRNMVDFGKTKINTELDIKQLKFTRDIENKITTISTASDVAGNALKTAGGIIAATTGPVGMIVGGLFNIGAQILNAGSQLEVQKLTYKKEVYDELTQFRKDLNEQTFSFAQSMIALTESTDKMLMKMNETGYQSARMMGLSADATERYAKGITYANDEMSIIGKTWEDMLKSQNAYITSSGRNMLLSTSNAVGISALSTLYGIGEEETSGIMGAMNVFNKSIEDGSDMMFTMYKTANKMGVSNQKFAKELQTSLKLSERYQFKGGVKGVMEMALWAQKMRVNMEEMSSALSKMHTGNVEDVIGTAARMNVLGGNAALYSDPMAMLFNAYADPQKYMENINKTIRGFGTVDRTTGETKFNIAEQMRIEQIANAMGVSVESLMNQARQANKAETISRRYGDRFGEYSDYVTQNALWSEKKGTFVVNVMDKNGKPQEKTLEELNELDMQNIVPRDTQETLVEYTRRIMSAVERRAGVSSYTQGRQAQGTYDKWEEARNEVDRLTLEGYKKYEDYYIQNTLDGFLGLIEAQKQQNELTEEMTAYQEKSGKTILEIINELSSDAFQQSLSEIPLVFNAVMDFATYGEKAIKELNPVLWEAMKSVSESENKKKKKTYGIEIPEGYDSIADAYSDGAIGDFGDVVITPKGVAYTHPDDMIAAFKPGGGIMNGLNAQNNGNGKLEISGTLRLDTGSQHIDLLDLVRNNPMSLRRLTEEILIEANKTKWGGRAEYNPNRFTL